MAVEENYELRTDLKGHVDEDNIIDQPLAADRMSPTIGVIQTSAKMAVVGRGTTMKTSDMTQRNTDGSLNRVQFNVGEQEYTTEDRGIEVVIDKIQQIVSSQYYNAQIIATQIAQRHLLIGREKIVAAGFELTSGFTDVSATLSIAVVGGPWDDVATAEPFETIDKIAANILAVAGLEKEVLTLSMDRLLLNRVMRCDEVNVRATNTLNTDAMGNEAQAQYFADYLGIKGIELRNGLFNNTGINSTTPVFTRVWDANKVQLFLKNSSGSFQVPGFSRQPVYTPAFGPDMRIDSYTLETNQQLVIRAQEWRGIDMNYSWGGEVTGTIT